MTRSQTSFPPALTAWLCAGLVALLGLLAVPGAAQDGGQDGSLVQLTFAGEVERPGGGRLEIEIAVRSGNVDRVVEIDAHFAQGTLAQDLTALVARQLELSEAAVVRGSTSEPRRGTLFIEGVTFVNLRLGYGLGADVTVSQGVPILRFVPPEEAPVRARFQVSASALQPHSKKRSHHVLELVCAPGDSGIQAAERLVLDAIDKGWVADRPRVDSVLPLKLGDGSLFTGFSIDFREMDADWRVELQTD